MQTSNFKCLKTRSTIRTQFLSSNLKSFSNFSSHSSALFHGVVIFALALRVCVEKIALYIESREYQRGSIIVPLTLCLTGLDQSVLHIKTKIVNFHTADSKPVKWEFNSTVIHPPLVFLFESFKALTTLAKFSAKIKVKMQATATRTVLALAFQGKAQA